MDMLITLSRSLLSIHVNRNIAFHPQTCINIICQSKNPMNCSILSGILVVWFLTVLGAFQCCQPDFLFSTYYLVVKDRVVLNHLLCCPWEKNFQTNNDGFYPLSKRDVSDRGWWGCWVDDSRETISMVFSMHGHGVAWICAQQPPWVGGSHARIPCVLSHSPLPNSDYYPYVQIGK